MPRAAMRDLTDDDRAGLEKHLSELAECVYHPSFRGRTVPGGDSQVAFGHDVRAKVAYSGEAASEPVACLSDTGVLSAEEERTLFLRFNYARYRAMRILHHFRGRNLTASATRELLRWQRLADQTRAQIVRANTSLVLAMARRSRSGGVELSELVSEGNLALLRCVDKFDAARGFKFSTYACRAILASFSRAAAKAARQRACFPSSYDPSMERSDYLERKRDRIELECLEDLKRILFENSADLTAVERRVLDARFALGRGAAIKIGSRRTLDQVGNLLGVSKERVRQIQNQAMQKLRAALEQDLLVAS